LKLQETLGMDVGEELRVTLEIISEVLFVVVVAWDENNNDKNNPSIIKLHDENNHYFIMPQTNNTENIFLNPTP
jgi:hypothetical protein